MPSSVEISTPQAEAQLPEYLTISEIASELRVSEFTVIGLVTKGELPALRIGQRGQYRVPRGGYELWKQEQLAKDKQA